MSEKPRILLLKDFVEQKERKEKELEFYRTELDKLNKKMWFVQKEIELTNKIIDIIENE
tara:strand:+ start:144 stop:320 length:177 start_codon:yes stop_codon:yes gene_type:complete